MSPRKGSSRGTPSTIPPSLPPERAIQELHRQLEALSAFEGRRWRDVRTEEEEWEQYTRGVIARAFGDPSSNLSNFYSAVTAGEHNVMGVSEAQLQRNFEERLRRYKPVLRSSIRELELLLPEPDIKGSYATGEQYDFYRDLKNLLASAQREVFIVDPYLDDMHFDLYVEKIPAGVPVRVLFDRSRNPRTAPALITVAQKYAAGGGFELRSSNAVHDRVIFVDDRVWVTGQSLKDAAGTKPTYIVEVSDVAAMKNIYEPIWTNASPLVP